MSGQLLIATECVRCAQPFGVRPKDLGEFDELLCIGCLSAWAQAGYPDELPPLGDAWTPRRPPPARRPMRRKRGDAARRPTDPEHYRP